MDVGNEFVIPNPYGLMPGDMDHDMDAYTTALGFLSDLTGGTDETRALEINGGNQAMLVMWQRSARFRRVLAKCRAGAARARLEEEKAKADHATAEPKFPAPGEQAFISFEDLPEVYRPLGGLPNPASFGAA